jgi:hypothetical protein
MVSKVFAFYVARQVYLAKNGGIDIVVNDLDKKIKYEKFISKLLSSKLVKGKSITWKQLGLKIQK